MEEKKYLVVGAGFSGAVLARALAEKGAKVTCIDKRNHIAGNCHTARDSQTNVMVHEYGPHIFNTNNISIWEYINRFGEMMPYKNRVIAETEKGMFSLPMNLLTINQFFNVKETPISVEDFLKTKQENIDNPQNFEEQALRFLGKELYDNFFYGYTKKQWGCEPKELPASILKRLPIRFNYEDNYYNSEYQGIPKDGYTKIVENILDHPNIEVQLNQTFDKDSVENFNHVFYTGALDGLLGFKYGRLGYRTVTFQKSVHEGDFQGNAVINYCEENIEHTRVHEHKHFTPWEEHNQTTVLTEYSKETGLKDEPYYPKRLTNDLDLLTLYKNDARENYKNFSFVGRLATYRYLNMDQVIEEALNYASYFIKTEGNPQILFSDEI